MENFDVIVIGSGPGGYVAAIRAAQLGLKTAIVERDPQLGGTCLLRGCIPTKSLLHAADLLESMKHAHEFGITVKDVGFDFAGVQAGRAKQVQKGAQGVAYLMKKNKIKVLAGHGRLKGANVVSVSDGANAGDYGAKNIIIATGSVPRVIPNITIDGKHFVTSDEILTLKEPPKSLLVMGAGAVGVEFASVFSRFGSTCTIIEMQDRVVPVEDKEISLEFAKLLQKRGIGVRTSTKLKSAEVKNKVIHATLTGPDGKDEVVQAQMMLVAIGRAPRTEDLGLDTIKVERDKGGFLAVDGLMRTATPNVYAIGDVVRTPWLAHVASSEGILAVDHIAGQAAKPINYKLTPGCTYSSPEIGSVGLTEAAAIEAGYDVKVGKFPFSAVAKARIMGDTEGFVKIVSDKRYDEILGVHIIGPHATDLIAEACVALRLECTTEELANIMHAHPSLSESIVEAAHATLGHAMHM